MILTKKGFHVVPYPIEENSIVKLGSDGHKSDASVGAMLRKITFLGKNDELVSEEFFGWNFGLVGFVKNRPKKA